MMVSNGPGIVSHAHAACESHHNTLPTSAHHRSCYIIVDTEIRIDFLGSLASLHMVLFLGKYFCPLTNLFYDLLYPHSQLSLYCIAASWQAFDVHWHPSLMRLLCSNAIVTMIAPPLRPPHIGLVQK